MTEINKQVFELNDEELDYIAGGAVRISANTNRVGFTTSGRAYALQNCTARQARNLCEELMTGTYANEAEYDAACEAALRERGWI